MCEKTITIVIPCYNVSKYIEKCIDSIVNTKVKDIEIILINDGSTDDTLNKLNFLKKQYKDLDLLIIDQENKGLSETRNVGVEIAKGEYLVFIDSDDWVEESYLDILFKQIQKGYDAVFVSYNRAYENKKEHRILNLNGDYEPQFIKRRLLGLYKEELKDPSQSDSMVTIWGKIYRTKIVKQNNLKFVSTKEIGTAEDLVFNLEYIQWAKKISIIDKPLYNYRKENLTSFTHSYKPNLFMLWQKKYQYIEHKIPIENEEEQQAFNNRIALGIVGLGLNELSNPHGRKSIIKNLQYFLSQPKYKRAYQQLDYRYFPIHWKVFFFLAKKNYSEFLYQFLKFIKFILEQKSK